MRPAENSICHTMSALMPKKQMPGPQLATLASA
jgi:hypothetical protein